MEILTVDIQNSDQLDAPPRQLGIFFVDLVSANGSNFTSTATVHNVTITQTGTDIYCGVEIGNYNEMDTLNVRS